MTTAEAAALLDVTERRVRAMIRQKHFRAERRGRDWWIDRRSLTAYIASRARLAERV